MTGRLFNDGWEYANAPTGWDRDGLQNGNDSWYAGVVVQLLDASGAVVATTTTNSSGVYSFTLTAGGAFRVRFFLPTSTNPMLAYRFTAPDQGSDDSIDSDADAATGESALFAVSLGGTSHQDAGVIWRYDYSPGP